MTFPHTSGTLSFGAIKPLKKFHSEIYEHYKGAPPNTTINIALIGGDDINSKQKYIDSIIDHDHRECKFEHLHNKDMNCMVFQIKYLIRDCSVVKINICYLHEQSKCQNIDGIILTYSLTKNTDFDEIMGMWAPMISKIMSSPDLKDTVPIAIIKRSIDGEKNEKNRNNPANKIENIVNSFIHNPNGYSYSAPIYDSIYPKARFFLRNIDPVKFEVIESFCADREINNNPIIPIDWFLENILPLHITASIIEVHL